MERRRPPAQISEAGDRQSRPHLQPVGVRASPLGVGLTGRDMEQPAQVMVIGRVSIIKHGGTSVA
jgi:hypothetical protein